MKISPYTVICLYPSGRWVSYDVMAQNPDDAHQMCQKMYPKVQIIWINPGFGNTNMNEEEIPK